MARGVTIVFRLFILTAILLLTTATLAVSANFLHLSTEAAPIYVVFAIVVSAVTYVAIIPLILLQIVRPHCGPFLVYQELLWTSLLGAIWFAMAVDIAVVQDRNTIFAPLPPDLRSDPVLLARYTALQDAIFLVWGLLWSWALWLLVLAIRAKRSGYPTVWTAPTTCCKFLEMQKIDSHPV